MADSTNTLAGLLKLNDANVSQEDISVILNAAPVLRMMNAQPASQGGTLHKFKRRLTAPGVGFRLVNEGITNAAGTFDIIEMSLALLDGSFSRDMGLAMGHKNGPTKYMDDEAMEAMAEAFSAAEKSIFRANLNKQFTGLPGSPYFDQIAGLDSQVIDAGGAGGSSVWIFRSAKNGISLIAGNDGRVQMATSDVEVEAVDENGGKYSALRRTILGWFGLQVACLYDAVRIANLDGTTGHTLTDSLISQALAKFPTGREANMIAMHRAKRQELQNSRTAVNATGAPAPFPTEAQGIPIVTTDSIPIDEAALNTTTTTTTTNTTTAP